MEQLFTSLALVMALVPATWRTNLNGTFCQLKVDRKTPQLQQCPSQTNHWNSKLLQCAPFAFNIRLLHSSTTFLTCYQLRSTCSLRHPRTTISCEQTVSIPPIQGYSFYIQGFQLIQPLGSHLSNMKVAGTPMMPITRCTILVLDATTF